MIAELKEMINFFIHWSPANRLPAPPKQNARPTNVRSKARYSRKTQSGSNRNFHAVQFESRRDSDGVMRIYEVNR